LSIARETGGTTTLSGPVADQAALYSILNDIHNLGLCLISFKSRTKEMQLGEKNE